MPLYNVVYLKTLKTASMNAINNSDLKIKNLNKLYEHISKTKKGYL